MKGELWPVIRFLLVFLIAYVGLSLSYGLWIESYAEQADFLTQEVAQEVAGLLTLFGGDGVTTQPSLTDPTVFIKQDSRIVLEVYEGCNGANVMIVFVSFVLAFGGSAWTRIAAFAACGLAIIYVANLFRLVGLYVLAFGDMRVFHYYHKYFFTAVLYLLVFAMWWLWITWWSGKGRVSL